MLNTLKALTFASYFFIQLNGEHIGGSLILFLFFGIFNNSLLIVAGTLILFLALLAIPLTIFTKLGYIDKLITPLSIIVLIVPVVYEMVEVIRTDSWKSTRPFQYSTGVFIILAIWIFVLIFKPKKDTGIGIK